MTTQNERALEWFNNLPIRTDNYDHTAHIKTIRNALQQNENLVYALQIAKRDIGNWVTHEEARDEAIAFIDKHLAEYEKGE